MQKPNAQTVKLIRAAIKPYLRFPKCKVSNRIFNDRCKSSQSYKLPPLTCITSAMQAIAALNIPNIQNLRVFNATCYYPHHKYQAIRFTLPRCN